jgi:hypothetical protein
MVELNFRHGIPSEQCLFVEKLALTNFEMPNTIAKLNPNLWSGQVGAWDGLELSLGRSLG